MIKLPVSKKRFTEFSTEGKEFIKMWNSADRDGIQKKLADHFNISAALVYRIRIRLGLPALHDVKNHPGKKLLYKRIKKMYLKRELSTSYIGRVVNMCDQRVNLILKEQNVELRPQHITNVAYIKTSSHLTPTKLLMELKRLYCDENLPAIQIAKRLGIDQGTVRAKLKAIGIHVEHRKILKNQIVVAPNYNIKGIYLGTSEPFSVICYNGCTVNHKGRSMEKRSKALCQWCKTEFPQYIDNGPRTQLYCCSRCKNRAKDFRRMLRGIKVSESRIQTMVNFLQNTWGKDYTQARSKIINTMPIITMTES
ncbi:hypothetical protein ACFL43_03845 [Thermodesulfobacteriota bacterium]